MTLYQPDGIVVWGNFFLETSKITAEKLLLIVDNLKIIYIDIYLMKGTIEKKIDMERSKIFESGVLITIVSKFYFYSHNRWLLIDMRQKLNFYFNGMLGFRG